MNKKFKYSLMLLVVSILWGFAFAFQSMGADRLSTFSFMVVRNLIALLTMGIIMLFRKDDDLTDNLYSAKIGLVCGLISCTASIIQQFSIGMTSAANTSFITSMYVIIVPAIGFFTGKKTNKKILICVVMELIGMYLLCIKDGFVINIGDAIMVIGAILYAAQIIYLDYGGKKMDPMIVCTVQFAVTFVVCTILMFIFEWPLNISDVKSALVPLLYTGMISSAVCSTIQVTVQKEIDPTLASIIMCAESVFGAIGGWILLNEYLNTKEIFGCLIMFMALILSQLLNKE